MAMTRRSFLTVTAVSTLLAVAPHAEGCGSKTIKIRKKYDLANIDPADYRADDEVITLAVFGSLVRKAADGTQYNQIAYSVDRDGEMEVRFKLLDGAKWSDGKQVTASDVKYSFERIASETLKAQYRDRWSVLERVDVTDSRGGQIVLRRPAPELWNVALPVGCGCIVSREAVDALAAKRFTTNPGPTAGRYHFVEHVVKSHVNRAIPAGARSRRRHGDLPVQSYSLCRIRFEAVRRAV